MHFYNTLLKDALAGLGSALNVEGRRISVWQSLSRPDNG
jgi:hypothetical protein